MRWRDIYMYPRLLALFICLSFLFCLNKPACAGDVEAGIKAYQGGDYKTALSLLSMAAVQGNAAAQTNIGLMYYKGQGVSKDYEQAARWYEMAADQGYAAAQFNLGYMYDQGQGVLQDYKKAAAWYRLAADQGYAKAQANLGVMYYKGIGVS